MRTTTLIPGIFGFALTALQWVVPMMWENIDPFVLHGIFWISIALIVISGAWFIWDLIMGKSDDGKGGFNLNIGQMFGGQAAQTINNFEDRSTKRQLRDLFNTIDPKVNFQTGRHVVRMEPHHLTLLSDLATAHDSPVKILQVGPPILGTQIDNGSLGITHACEVQHRVEIDISQPLV